MSSYRITMEDLAGNPAYEVKRKWTDGRATSRQNDHGGYIASYFYRDSLMIFLVPFLYTSANWLLNAWELLGFHEADQSVWRALRFTVDTREAVHLSKLSYVLQVLNFDLRSQFYKRLPGSCNRTKSYCALNWVNPKFFFLYHILD